MSYSKLMCTRMWQGLCVAALALFVAAPGHAESEILTLFDLDDNPATGCSVATADGAFDGVERVIITTVATAAPPTVTGVVRQICSGGVLVNDAGFVPMAPLSWPVGMDNGALGDDVVETYAKPGPIAPGQQVRIGFMSRIVGGAPGDSDAVILAGGQAITFDIPEAVAIPALSTLGALVLSLAMAVAIFVFRRRLAARGVTFVLLFLVTGWVFAWFQIVRDGQVNDWVGISPSWTDSSGDGPPNADIRAIYMWYAGGRFDFRFDMDIQPDLAPTVIETTPLAAEASVASDTNLTITFSEPVYVTGDWFDILCSSTGLRHVAGTTVSANAEQSIFTIDPNSDFAAGETCTVTVVHSLVGDLDSIDPPDTMPSDHMFSFTVDALPSVVSSTPAANATGVARAANVTLNFSEAVDVSGNWFQIDCPSGMRTPANSAVSGSGTATLTIDPNADFTESEHCTVTVFAAQVRDVDAIDPPDAMATDHVFGFDVVVINNPPSFTAGADRTVLEDVGPVTVAGWATAISPGPAHESGQTVSFEITDNTNPTLFLAAPGVAANGTLTFTPAANANGSATIKLRARDAGGTADGGVDVSSEQTFVITVTPVNDMPSFIKGGDQVVLAGVGARTLSGWATVISPGPSDESAQTVSFIITGNTNEPLFSALPAVDTSGTLTYTPAPGAYGSATISLTAQDNGGVLDGGVDTSAAQSFTITVNQPPIVTSAASKIFTVGTADSFTYTANGHPATFTYSLTGCTLPAPLALSGVGNNTLSGTAQAGTGGTYSCTLNVSNGIAPDTTQAFSLSVHEAPTATDDSAYTTVHDAALTETTPGILDNDSLAMPVAAIESVGGTTCGSFPCTRTTAQGGNVDVASNGGFTYTPPADFAGSDSFTYTLSNSVGNSTGTVTIDVTDVAPVVDLNGPTPNGIDFGPVAFTEAGGAVPIVETVDPDKLTVADADGTLLASATIVITNVQDDGAESVSVTCPDTPPPADKCSGAILTTDIVATPGAGTYTLTITRDAPLADYEALLRTLVYNNTSLNPTVAPDRVVTVTINDKIVDNNPVAQATVTVAAINTAPVLAAIEPAALSYDATTAATAITSTLTVDDADNADLASATVQITSNCVSADDVLSFTGQSGIGGTYDSGTCTLTLSGTASPANYQAALRSVKFGNMNPATSTAQRVVSFQVDDGEAANHASNTQTRNIDVKVNIAPVLTAGGTLNFSENDSATAIDNTITVSDSDSPNLVGATVEITTNCASAEDVLSFVNQNGITGTPGTCTLTLSGTASLANYQAALRSVAYRNSSETPSTLARTVTWQVDDGGAANNLSNTATSTVNVAAVNDAPVLTAGATLGYTENGTATAIDTSIAVSDADSVNLTSATVQITANCNNPEDVLSFVDQNGISGVYTAATCTLALSGTASLANYQTALRSVAYHNTSDNPVTLARTVTWIGDDGQAVNHASTSVTSTINVTAVNDAPVLATIEGAALAYTENAAATDISSTLTLTDVDSSSMAGATVQITGNYQSGQDVLSFTDQLGITGSFDVPSGTLTLTGTTTLANYRTALRAVKYSNSSNDPSTLTRTATFRVNDGGAVDNLSNIPTRDITVTAVNDPPTANGFSNLPAQAGIPITYPAGKLGGTDVEAGTTVTVKTTPGSLCTDCVLTLNADGGFTFTPPPSAAGTTVSFTYYVTDNGSPGLGVDSASAATVSFDVAGAALYFVKSATVGTGSCALGNECTLAAALTKIGATTNTRIFIEDNGNYTDSVSLNSNGWLVGQGVTGTTFDTLFGISTPAQGTLATRPSLDLAAPTITIASVGVNAVNLNGAGTANSVRGLLLSTGTNTTKAIAGTGFGTLTTSDLTISGSGPALDLTTGSLSGSFTSVSSSGGANGIKLTTIGGSTNLGSGALSGASGHAFVVDGGAGSITYGGTINNTAVANVVRVANKTGGTVAFTGAVASTGGTGTGVLLSANTGATVRFAGGLQLSTGGNAAFTATGGGTVEVCDEYPCNSVATGGLVNTLTSSTGTALNVTSTNIGANNLEFRSIAASGGGNGIYLSSTGSSGGLKVKGTGSAGSGGTIANMSGADGATAGIGIYLANTSNVSLDRMQLNDFGNFAIWGSAVTNFTLANSVISGTNGTSEALNEGSVSFANLAGSASISGTNISGGLEDNVRIANTSGTLNRITFSNVNIGANSTASGNDGIVILAEGNSVVNATVQNSTFTSARGDLFQLVLNNTGSSDLVFTGNALSNNHPSIATGGGGFTVGGGSDQGITFTYNIDNNTFRDAVGTAILIVKSTDSGSVNGSFTNNVVGNVGARTGSKEGSGMKLQSAGKGTLLSLITGNTFKNYANYGMDLVTGGGATAQSGTFHTTLRSNTVSVNDALDQNLGWHGFHVNGGTVVGDTFNICADVGGAGLANNFTGSSQAVSGGVEVRVRQRQSTVMTLPNLTPTPTSTPANLDAYLQSRNTAASYASAIATSVSAGNCNLP